MDSGSSNNSGAKPKPRSIKAGVAAAAFVI